MTGSVCLWFLTSPHVHAPFLPSYLDACWLGTGPRQVLNLTKNFMGDLNFIITTTLLMKVSCLLVSFFLQTVIGKLLKTIL